MIADHPLSQKQLIFQMLGDGTVEKSARLQRFFSGFDNVSQYGRFRSNSKTAAIDRTETVYRHVGKVSISRIAVARRSAGPAAQEAGI